MKRLSVPPHAGHDVPVHPTERAFGSQHSGVSEEHPELEGIHDPRVVAGSLDDPPHFGIDLPLLSVFPVLVHRSRLAKF